MSDVQQGPGWWLASDGRWYPPELAPASPDGTPAPAWGAGPMPGWEWQPTAPSVNPTLARALRLVFFVVAAVCGVAALLHLWTLLAYRHYDSTGSESAYDAWVLPDRILGWFGVVTWPLGIGLLVLVIIWSWQAHEAATALGWDLRWRLGWTIGCWFIPCAALVLPKLVIGNIERLAMARRRDGRAVSMWHTLPSRPMGWVWWLGFVLFQFRAGAAGASFTAFYVVNTVAPLFGVISALAGASYFTTMSNRLTPEGLAAHRDD